MSPYKTTDHTPPTPTHCTVPRLSLLLQAGIETDGHIDHLRKIITDGGYNLPGQEGEYWGFVFHPKGSTKVYTRLYLN